MCGGQPESDLAPPWPRLAFVYIVIVRRSRTLSHDNICRNSCLCMHEASSFYWLLTRNAHCVHQGEEGRTWKGSKDIREEETKRRSEDEEDKHKELRGTA